MLYAVTIYRIVSFFSLGVELGIGDMILIRSIAQATGRSVEKIKLDTEQKGDLGIVAEQSRSNQRIMFQPAKLTVRGVFDKLKEIAVMTGNAVCNAFKVIIVINCNINGWCLCMCI